MTALILEPFKGTSRSLAFFSREICDTGLIMEIEYTHLENAVINFIMIDYIWEQKSWMAHK